MNRLLVTWKNPVTRYRYEIGELQKENNEYTFLYNNKEVEKAKKDGFQSFGEFVDLETKYIQREGGLFVSFKTRIPSRKRKDFVEFLKKFGEERDPDEVDDFEILKLTRGALATDTIEVFEDIDFSKKEFETFLVGVRHYINEETYLKQDMTVGLVLEDNNSEDKNAIYLVNEKEQKLGYIPRIYSENIRKWLAGKKYKVEIVKLLKLGRIRVEIKIKLKRNN